METNDLLLSLADLYIQLGDYQRCAQIIGFIRPLTFGTILEIVKFALTKVCKVIKCWYNDVTHLSDKSA